MLDDGGHELAGKLRGDRVALGLFEVPLEDGFGRPLAEICFEDRRQGETPAGPPAADAVSSRRHRPGS